MSHPDRVAAVTGASGGIGRGIAVRLAQAGAAVAVSGRSPEGGAETVRVIEEAGGLAHFTPVDVTSNEQVAAWIADTHQRFGRLDWLVNNAGINGDSARIEDQPVEEFEQVVITNLFSAFYTVHAAIPIMRAQGGGAIVNVGSAASLQGYALLSGYTASKHGMLGLTKSIALENADIPIRANLVCPGPVDTPLMQSIEVLVNPEDPGAARAMFEGTIAMRRYGQISEIADAVAYLLSDGAAFITGTALSVDGGVMSGVG
ncbi:SDR family oxidoreductase [Baekduia soli]|uniref:SDR family oxidoreductase n=1 Tax=Baekduia soli TaxID=496014 RepID=A0A5B8U3E9_9ACTN|nr:SDR family NAD(P)-dependent oxidoreductase [Baekduia soli]QEC47569.1 SDR family oxidoreductase [Baekduia soli]